MLVQKDLIIEQLEAAKEEIENQLFATERDLYEKINDFKDFRLSVIDQAKFSVGEH